MAQPKAKLRTSEDVFKRLKFATEYDEDSEFFQETDLWIGYEDGIYGPMEQRLSAFVPIDKGGDLPFHSIWYFRRGEYVFWDRRRRHDLLWHSGETENIMAVAAGKKVKDFDASADRRAQEQTLAAVKQAAETLATLEEERKVKVEEQRKRRERQAARRAAEREKKGSAEPKTFEVRELGVVELNGHASQPRSALRVLTWNAMFDDFLESYPATAASEHRAPGLAAAIAAADPDIVLLQELTSHTVAAVDGVWQGWRSEVLGELAVWSRYPIRRAVAVALGTHTSKQALLVEVAALSRSLAFACVHFTSDRRGENLVDNSRKRMEQAQITRDALVRCMPASDHFVCGDFNEPSASGHPAAIPVMAGLVDAWAFVHADALGCTFDPSRNALAAVGCVDPSARRIDRIFASATWQAASAELLGQDAQHSDHYGLLASFDFSSKLATAKPVHTSAMVLLPPESCWGQIDAIRSEFDPSFGRWMPHINMIYGFLPEEDFCEAALAMEQVVRRHGPLELRLEQLTIFEHGAGASLVIVPACLPANALNSLQADLAALFPSCQEQARHGQFTAHLTLGKFDSVEDARRRLAELNQEWKPICFCVDELALISRPPGGPFALRQRVPLGANLDSRDTAVLDLLQAASGCRAYAVGSAMLLGSERPRTSDFDVLLLGTRPREEVFDALERALRPRWARRAEGRVPILELELPDGGQLDIMYSRTERLEHPITWPEASCLEDIAVGSLRDALALRSAVLHGRGWSGWRLFQEALPRLRRWTKARRVEGNVLGLLGGFAWAILLAETLVSVEASSAEDLVAELHRRFAAWPWPKPVMLGAAEVETQDPMPIICPSSPFSNAARNVTASTRDFLLRELQCSARNEATRPPLEAFQLLVRVEVKAEAPTLQLAAAWVESRLLLLIRSLDAYGARPVKIDRGLWVVGATADRGVLDHAVRNFLARLEKDPGENFCDMVDVVVESRDDVRNYVKAKAATSSTK